MKDPIVIEVNFEVGKGFYVSLTGELYADPSNSTNCVQVLGRNTGANLVRLIKYREQIVSATAFNAGLREPNEAIDKETRGD